MHARTPIFKNEGIRPGPDILPEVEHLNLEMPPPLPRRKRMNHRNIALGVVGLALFAVMGVLLGNFIVALHLHWPWYFPH